MAYNILTILDTIRDNGSLEYSSRVPSATDSKLDTIGQAILSYSATTNEFLNQLVNRIAMTMIDQKIINNPLSPLKKGGIPLGQDIEHLFVNPANGESYASNSTDLLTVKTPDVKSTFYRLNRQDKFTVSIYRQQLVQAFTSETAMSQLIDYIVQSLYSGDNFQEFILMKNLMSRAVHNNHLVKVNVFDENATGFVYSDITSKEIVKQVKTYSKMFTFPSSNYNKYSTVKGSGDPVITWTPVEDQILILNAGLSATIDVDVLAYAFQLDKMNMPTIIEVDDFGDEPVLAILTDKSFFQVYDNDKNVDSFYNPDTRAFKYFLHHWQTYAYNLYANAVALTYTPKTV